MADSKMLAALIGPTMLVAGVMVLLNLGLMHDIVAELAREPLLVVVVGFITFVPGLAIVLVHNHWKGGWPVIVTVVGWLCLIAGLARILFPAQIAQLAENVILVPGLLPEAAVVLLALGGFLSFKAFGRK
jgi:cytochrome bd-type quinol oxidase subunit 2